MFTVQRNHNAEISGKPFKSLDPFFQTRILSYEFSTHILPPQVEDQDVLRIFARLNSTGTKLNHQELRNAAYFGIFKTLMYDLAYEQLDRWRQWRVFTEDQIARMDEVQLTSDLALNIMDGLSGRLQARINSRYEQYDEFFPAGEELSRRFREVMEWIDRLLGPKVADTVYKGEVYFHTLFVLVYDELFQLGSSLAQKIRPNRLDEQLLRNCLLQANRNFATFKVPQNVMDAVARASSDIGRRKTRFEYVKNLCRDQAER
jgi:hypothetical protein